MFNVFSSIEKYESIGLDWEETVELFQHLLDMGMLWNLQGHYGRIGRQLIDSGDIKPKQ